ncbi:hypothetical protein [Thiohalobacter sp. COW1]|nr:hypothetical protein [Thiohalobacter sp. COW1]
MNAVLRHINALTMSCGLGTVGYGLWLVHEPLAFLVVGAVLFWAGLPD